MPTAVDDMHWTRRARRIPRRSLTELSLIALRARTAFSTSPVTGEVDAVVSLTTFGPRYRKVHLAIESIARGSRRPRRLILWIDDPQLLQRPTRALARLMKRGLEIRECPDYGSHKKYFPALSLVSSGRVSRLVTADDDTLYPRQWLRELEEAALAHPGEVICHRARVVQLDHHGFAPWIAWPRCETSEPSLLHIGIGDTGVSYPLRVVVELEKRGLGFEAAAPKADDVWLHAAAVSAGVRVRQVRARGAVAVGVPGTQSVSLREINVNEGLNDTQIAATYSEQNKAALRAETERAR